MADGVADCVADCAVTRCEIKRKQKACKKEAIVSSGGKLTAKV